MNELQKLKERIDEQDKKINEMLKVLDEVCKGDFIKAMNILKGV